MEKTATDDFPFDIFLTRPDGSTRFAVFARAPRQVKHFRYLLLTDKT
jgi:hypothetical protein